MRRASAASGNGRLCAGNMDTTPAELQQHCGKSGDAADVIGLPGIHMEVKRVEHLDLYGALDQAKRDARPGKIPIVAHRRNDCRWVVIMDAENWFRIYREYEAGRPRTEIGIEEDGYADTGGM